MKNYLIYGYGRSGKAVHKLLEKEIDAIVYIYDDNQSVTSLTLEEAKQIALSAHKIIISPGIDKQSPLYCFCVQNNLSIEGEFEFASKRCKGKQIAITGTNGKTTICTLLGHILRQNKVKCHVAGNIGLPFSEICDKVNQEDFVVLEVSSFQLEDFLSYKPYISVITNITPDHLDRHKSYENYILSKCNILRNHDDGDLCILNYDDYILRSLGQEIMCRVAYFSASERLDNCVYFDKNSSCFVYKNANTSIKCDYIKYYDSNSIINICCTCAICFELGLNWKQIARGISTFNFLDMKHRVEFVGTFRGVDFYNDSKATNVGATLFAAERFENFSLILGGSDKGYSFDGLFNKLKGCRYVVCVGDTSDCILESARRSGFKSIIKIDTLEQAVETSFLFMKDFAPSVVLFSPACASFDRYENYERRGEDFKQTVLRFFDTAKTD